MDIRPIRAFRDNYLWLIVEGRRAVVVDPGDAAPVAAALDAAQLDLAAILVTHHHPDHVGGVAALAAGRGIPVYGPAGEDIAAVTVRVREPDHVQLPELGLELAVLDVPGHTRGHVAYHGAGVLFCGDTLFGCGCGRLFEGTPEQMWRSLAKLAALPADTRIYCAHEYTQANIDFALAVEPDNARLLERAERVDALRSRGEPTVPLTLAEELATNPFLRSDEPAVVDAASRRWGPATRSAVEVFAAVRKWKDQF